MTSGREHQKSRTGRPGAAAGSTKKAQLKLGFSSQEHKKSTTEIRLSRLKSRFIFAVSENHETRPQKKAQKKHKKPQLKKQKSTKKAQKSTKKTTNFKISQNHYVKKHKKNHKRSTKKAQLKSEKSTKNSTKKAQLNQEKSTTELAWKLTKTDSA